MNTHPLRWEHGRLARPGKRGTSPRATNPHTATLGGGSSLALLASLTLGLALGAATAQAQTGGSYDLTWSSVDGGGGTSTGGSYSLSGSAGQPDASGDTALSGGTYALTGGFWAGATAQYRLYLPLVVKSYAGGW